MKKSFTAILLLAISFAAHAGWYGIGAVGEGQYFLSSPSNPAWCQHPYECFEGKDVAVWSLGAGHAFTSHAAAELSYHDFGKYTQSGAWRCSDDNSMCAPWTTYGTSEARTRGVSLSSVFGMEQGIYGRLGALRYQSKWQTRMYYGGIASTSPNIYIAQRQYGWSPEIGIGWRWRTGYWVDGEWRAELTRYTDIKPHDGAIQGITTATLQLTF
jgi:hypothetical protein